MILIKNGNFVPEEVLLENQYEKFKKVAKKWLKILNAVLLVLLLFEGFLFYYFNGIVVPPVLVMQYEIATSKMDGVKKELAKIENARKEDQNPVAGLTAVLGAKPLDVKLSTVSIGQVEGNPAWVTFDCVGINLVSFSEFTGKLNQDADLAGAVITKISSPGGDKGNSKTATIIVGRR